MNSVRDDSARATPSAVENIENVARLEQQLQDQRSRIDRIADAIADFSGRIVFAFLHLLIFASWFAINMGAISWIRPFDPYPFTLLSMSVSCEAVLLSTFVLIKQNRMSRVADHRAHLNLQIDLLAEKEITKLLQMQQKLCEHFGIKEVQDDQEIQELSQHTQVEAMARELKGHLPQG